MGPFGSCESDQARSGPHPSHGGKKPTVSPSLPDHLVCDRNLIRDQDRLVLVQPCAAAPMSSAIGISRSITGAWAARVTPMVAMMAPASRLRQVRVNGSGSVLRADVRVGERCRFDAARDDDRNQCQGGSLCHFDGDRDEGVCVASCSPSDAHGSVRCSDGTTCLAGRCLSREQQCDPGAQASVERLDGAAYSVGGSIKGCAVCRSPTRARQGHLATRARSVSTGPSARPYAGASSRRPVMPYAARLRGAGAAHATPAARVCPSSPSNGQVVSDWGLCVPAVR